MRRMVCKSIPVLVLLSSTLAFAADLQANFADHVDVLTGVSTRKANIGFPARFTVEAENVGSSVSPAAHARVVLSRNDTFSLTQDTPLADVPIGPVAANGGKALFDFTTTIPTVDRDGTPLATGDYWMFVQLDSFNVINEPNEANNTIAVIGPVRLRTPAADYAVIRVEVPERVAAGEVISLKRVLQNVGTDAGAVTEYACFASVSDDIRVTDFALEFVGATPSTRLPLQLGAGQTDSATEWVRIPGTLPSGNYFIGCLIDPDRAVPELEEDNNAVASAQTTQIESQSFQIVTQQLSDAVVGVPYRFGLATTHAPGAVTWSTTTALPEGLELGTDGVLTGTPQELGLTSLYVKATSNGLLAERVLVLRAVPPSGVLVITTEKLLPVVNSPAEPYQAALSAAGGTLPYRWSIVSGTLPQNLQLDGETGVLSGTPRHGLQVGTYPVQIRVQDGSGVIAQKELTFRVVPPGSLTITSVALPDSLAGEPYANALAASMAGGGSLTLPLSWSVVSGSLPPGLNLETHKQTAGLITGTPQIAGTYAFAAQVVDGDGRMDVAAFVIRIFPSTLRVALEDGAPVQLRPGDSVEFSVVAAGTGSSRFHLFSGALPEGLSLQEDGTISGTVSEGSPLGLYGFAVEATDAAGATGLGALSVEVVPHVVQQGCSSTAAVPGFAGVLALLLLAMRRQRSGP